MIRRLFLPTVVLLLAACGSSKTPAQPSAGPVGGPGAFAGAVLTISAGSGAEAFSPNPVSVTAGLRLLFSNSDTVAHRIVADSGAWDSGEIGPGVLNTGIVTTTASGGPFHCALHTGATGTLTMTGGRGAAH